MKTWQKVSIGVGVLVLILGMVWFSTYQVNKGVVTVQTGQAVRQDLTSLVTASGEIRPKSYTNVLAEGYGKITDIVVVVVAGRVGLDNNHCLRLRGSLGLLWKVLDLYFQHTQACTLSCPCIHLNFMGIGPGKLHHM